MRGKGRYARDPHALADAIAQLEGELAELYALRATLPHPAAEYGWAWCECGRGSGLIGPYRDQPNVPVLARADLPCDHCRLARERVRGGGQR